MIQAKDLRIGNLLQDKSSKTFLKVIELKDKNIYTYVIDRSKFPLKEDWSLEPVQLTEEILLKCESKFDFLNFELKKIGEQCSLFYCGLFIKDVNYLHEYQNVHHALTGEELTVTL